MFFTSKNKPRYIWKHLTTPNDVDQVMELSFDKPLVVFKHSERCSISSMALSRFEEHVQEVEKSSLTFIIDVVENRPASLHTAEKTGVTHQSPQVLVIFQGKAILDDSHNAIDVVKVLKKITDLK
jgi:bacillithiol system protein YtxJ